MSGLGVLLKEELCEKEMEVRRVSDKVMTVVLVFEEDIFRLICGYALLSEISSKKLFCR